ncbi:MAG: AAA family ATPase, partial [Bacteroidaceae bacterium]|nr:AAA family ATPase [Bacteroidaceae bacterium]
PTAAPTEHRWELSLQQATGDSNYLIPLLEVGTQLNLLEAKIDGQTIAAAQIIYEPDYLIDVSSVTACIQPYGISHLLHAINKLQPRANTSHILLGNLASQMLDEAIQGFPPDYKECMRRYFANNALQFIACNDLTTDYDRQKFHAQAREQLNNIYNIVEKQIGHELHLTGKEQIVLEPSFFCEALGMQGRMDFLTRDFNVVIEQKSGKKDLFRRCEQTSHKVQMLLYMAMLHYGLGKAYSDIQPYLLYSKYAGTEGFLRIQNAPKMLHDAISVRNKIVHQELQFAQNGAGEFFDSFHPEMVHNIECGKLWTAYTLPQLELFQRPIKRATPLERAYFYRFHQFLSLEQRISKLGTSEREASGFAAAWLSTTEEKQQAGNIMKNLRFVDFNEAQIDETKPATHLRFAPSTTDLGDITTTPNFRVGDIVVAYAYPAHSTGDIRSDMVFRGTILSINAEEVVVRMRAPQSNRKLFDRPKHLWAIEPDLMESAGNTLFRGLFAFLSGPQSRRDLLLGARQAVVDTTQRPAIHHQHDTANILLAKAVQARDVFLLVGPPGTGKTSVGLVSLLQNELANPQAHVLLAAFTNRAVDEICSKLVKENLDFIRLGNSSSCHPDYKPYLLEQKVQSISKLEEVETLLRSSRICVGTTASLASNTTLFKLNRFSLAIIDEASQLLEPHLLPLLMAEHEGELAIDRFVLIGDHKQLPAIVQQSEEESRIDQPALQAIELHNCRQSLFERFIKILPPTCIHWFTQHGRMHPEVADFANRHFYDHRLNPIPLPHQNEVASYARMEFYPCRDTNELHLSPKTNEPEAQLIAQLCLKHAQRLVAEGQPFSPDHTLGVIVPYRHQIALIRRELSKLDFPHLDQISIDTVERFQGSERDIIIYGFTVSKSSQLQFLCNSQFIDEDSVLIDRKLNVVLTRAKLRTIIVGNPDI